jgi:hypothetical protein
LGSTHDVPPDEEAAQIDVITHFLNLASNTRYLGWPGTEYGAENLHGAQTTRENILWAAEGCYDSYAIVFHVGHGWSQYVWNGIFYEEQWFIIDDSGSVHVFDKEIYPHSVGKDVFFAFLWSCHQGDVIGGSHWSGTPFGMPYAWRNSNQMSDDGYTNPIGDGLFIGFQGLAPRLTRTMAGRSSAGANFTKYFYSSAFQEDWTINQALDEANRQTFGVDSFADCIFRTGYTIDGDPGRMVVYGFSLLELYKYGITGGGGGGDPIPY